MNTPSQTRVRWQRQLAEPARGWVVWAPRTWSVSERSWTNLATGALETAVLADPAATPSSLAPEEAIDELVYLPPCPPEVRDRFRTEIDPGDTGTPPIRFQVDPEAARALPANLRPAAIIDLTEPVLAGDLDALSALPPDSSVLWPLLPGISDRSSVVEDGCAALAAAGVAITMGIAVDLTPVQRRRLAEAHPEAFDALFHGSPPSERDFARAAARSGMSPFLDRPDSGRSERRRRNRRLATALTLAGDLSLRLERPVSAGQELLRAARATEGTHLDLASIARDGNLGVLDWLGDQARSLVEETLAGRRETLDRLIGDYLAD